MDNKRYHHYWCVVVVVFLILAGIQYITWQRDVKQADAARPSINKCNYRFHSCYCSNNNRTVFLNL